MPAAMNDSRIPVTLLTGYLGAGKTTVLNHLLEHRRDKRFAVIVNEFGDIGVDGELIETGSEELIELSSGCICCVVRGDLIRTLRRLLKREARLHGILIETTGVANPSPVIQTFFADQTLAAQCRLDAVVTVVDALNIARQLQSGTDAQDQIALASVILLNKTAGLGKTHETLAQLRALNPFAPIVQIDRGKVDPSLVTDTDAFELERIDERFKTLELDHGHVARDGIGTLALTTDHPLDEAHLQRWLQDLLAVHGANILRTKGIIWVDGNNRKLVVQAVHKLLEGDYISKWDHPGPRTSRLIFIGRNLDADALRAGFLNCRATVAA
jgi:G3E family GTPase